MIIYECVIAPVREPETEETVMIEAKDKGEALIKNFELRPGTFVKAIREIGANE
jgi:hypothetical protein